MKAKGLRDIIIWLIDHLTDTQVNGAENIPTEGGLLICTNHMSRLDIPVLFTNPKRAIVHQPQKGQDHCVGYDQVSQIPIAEVVYRDGRRYLAGSRYR